MAFRGHGGGHASEPTEAITEAAWRPDRRAAASWWVSCRESEESGLRAAASSAGAKYPRECSNESETPCTGKKSPQSRPVDMSRALRRKGAPVPALASPAEPPNQWEKKTKSYSCGAKTIRG